MVRFDHAQRLLRGACRPALGTVAAVAGYADQSHMTAGGGRSSAPLRPRGWRRSSSHPFKTRAATRGHPEPHDDDTPSQDRVARTDLRRRAGRHPHARRRLRLRGTALVTGDDPQVVEHAELRWPEGGVMLGTADRDGNEVLAPPDGDGGGLHRDRHRGRGVRAGDDGRCEGGHGHGRPGLRRAHGSGARPREQPVEPRVVPGRVTTASARLEQGVIDGHEPEPAGDL